MDRSSRPLLAAASLIAGPALMSIGDLMHPAESLDASEQVAIVAAATSRWYTAHLLLFIGLIVLIPGILALTRLVAERKPRLGYAARLCMLASVGAFSAVFGFEMLLGRFISGGAAPASAVAVLQTFQSAAVFGVLIPPLIAFFVGTALFVVPLVSAGPPFRWPALTFAIGASLILAEIVSATVLLSKIGNVLIFVAATALARVLPGPLTQER